MRTMNLLALPLLLALTVCRASSESTPADSPGPVPLQPQLGEQRPAPSQPRDRSITIARGDVHVPHEVELDPRGEVALTLDAHGGLRLWPAIRSGDPELCSPYVLPIREPMWMTLAQADDGFVVATIDTANAGQVVAVQPSADGREAKLTPLFSIPPSDPLLELHALDGGQRFLALGVDHRVRLYDRSGTLISVIDQRSFAPWQLRVVHGEPGQPPKLAAILAQPLRVQALELHDDQLSIRAEPRTVVLDRGPNRNDLALSPDGETVAALRRRSGRSREFSIELIDLETDARRLVAGTSDSVIRPRMHFVDAERLLLETGSTRGRGMWIELAKAELLADPSDADPKGDVAKRLAKSKHDTIPLAASAEHKPSFFDPELDPPWDHGERMYASVVTGLRVNIERDRTNKLIIDPLDSDRHFALSGSVLAHQALALDHTGAHAAVALPDKQLRIVRIDGSAEPVDIAHDLANVAFAAFVDDRHVVLVGGTQLRLIDTQARQVVATRKLEQAWGVAAIAFHHDADGTGGLLGYRSGKPSEPIRLIAIDQGQLGETTTLARPQRKQWLDILQIGDAEAGSLFGMTASQAYDRVDEYTSDRTGRMFFTEKSPRTPLIMRENTEQRTIVLPAGQGRILSVSPEGSKIAIVQFRKRDDSRDREDHLLSVIDVASGQRLWTIGSSTIAAPSWSADGGRIVVNQLVHDAATGELVGSLAQPRLTIEDRSDADWAKQTGFLLNH